MANNINDITQGFDQVRGTGRTTKMIEALRTHSCYIVTHQNEVDHIKRVLLPKITISDRGTIDFFTLDWLMREAWHGRRYEAIVIDHAVQLTMREWDLLRLARAHCCK